MEFSSAGVALTVTMLLMWRVGLMMPNLAVLVIEEPENLDAAILAAEIIFSVLAFVDNRTEKFCKLQN